MSSKKRLFLLAAPFFLLAGCEYSTVHVFDNQTPKAWEYVPAKVQPAAPAAPTKQAEPPKPTIQELKKYTLNSAPLFAAGKTELSVKGTAVVQTIAGEISNNLPSVRSVNVYDYTEPAVGKAPADDSLSQQRAQAVAAILQKGGVPAALIRTEGRGQRDLLVNDCAQRFKRDKAGRDACNLPNRRVLISVMGMPKQEGVATYIGSRRYQAPAKPEQPETKPNNLGWVEQTVQKVGASNTEPAVTRRPDGLIERIEP